MHDAEGIKLPASGLAEDILAQFVDTAQKELDTAVPSKKSRDEEIGYHLVTFHLANKEYGVEIESVQEIIRATDITPVPGAQAHVRGVINLRGKIIPVVDLRIRFGLPTEEWNDQQRIVVVELGQKRLGMLVDSVSQVIRVPAAVVEEIPEEVTAIDDNYIKGVGKLDGRLVIMLDLNRSLLTKDCQKG